MRKLTIITTLVVLTATVGLASLGLVTMAAAQAELYTDNTICKCDATIDVKGEGIAVIVGRGKIELQGEGILWINDKGGDARINVVEYKLREEYNDGWIQYDGFKGTADIQGSRVIVVLAGTGIDLHAEGCGRVRLWGHGSYHTDSHNGEWGSMAAVRMIFANRVI